MRKNYINKVLDVKPLVPLFIKKYANSLTNILTLVQIITENRLRPC